jgi:hypothetical protein
VVVIYGLMGAAAAWRGKPFRYAVVGSLLEEMQNAAEPIVSSGTAPEADEAAEPMPDQAARSASDEAAKD